MLAKQTLRESLSQLNTWCLVFFTRQQQIGIVLVVIICFAFYLMVKSEDRNLKLKKQNIKKRRAEAPIQILSDSVLQQNLPQISSIMVPIQYEERVFKLLKYL